MILKMKKIKNSRNAIHKIYNKQFFIFPIVSAVLLFSAIICAFTDDIDIALFTAILSILIAIGIFVCPIYFLFDSKKITMKCLVYKKVIHYSSITSIIESKIFQSYDNFPKYEIMYLMKYRGESVIRQFNLPRNREIKKMVDAYLKSKIVK